MSGSHNRNPAGKNQWGDKPTLDNEDFVRALQKYHREGKTSNHNIKELLLAEYGFDVSAATIGRRRSELGLHGSRSKKHGLSEKEIEQVVLVQMDKDLGKKSGKATMKAKIAWDQNIHLTRNKVSEIMHAHDPEGFKNRHPGSKKIKRAPVVSIGIHEQWSGDGHDKLYKIGFPVWALVDVASTKVLRAWVVPSNREGATIAYLFLCLVIEYGGIPVQVSTDCGSETTQLYGLVRALREMFAEHLPDVEIRAYRYSQSIHNIVVERTWGKLKIGFGDNAVKAFDDGAAAGVYDPEDDAQRSLCLWLWAKLLRQELEEWVAFHNSFKMRFDSKKAGPSGASRNDIFALHHKHGLSNELIRLSEEQLEIVKETRDFMETQASLDFVSKEFGQQAEEAFNSEGFQSLTFENCISMGKCMFCAEDFPRLGENEKCGRCMQRKPGQVPGEIAYILSKPQCAACGVCSSTLVNPLCNPCIKYYKDENSQVPKALLRLEGLVDLIADTEEAGVGQHTGAANLSSHSIALLSSAKAHKDTASKNRLGKPTTNVGGLNAFGAKASGKTAASSRIQADRAAKHQEAAHQNTGLRVTVTLWITPVAGGVPKALDHIKVLSTFAMDVKIKDAYESLLTRIKSVFEPAFQSAKKLTWENVRVYAQDSTKKAAYASLAHIKNSLPVSKLFQEFLDMGYLNETDANKRKISLRFWVVEWEEVAAEYADVYKNSVRPSSAKPMSGRPASAEPGSRLLLSKKADSLRSRVLKSTVRAPGASSSLEVTEVLRSAFPSMVPPNSPPRGLGPEVSESEEEMDAWTRDCTMVTLPFFRTEVSYKMGMAFSVKFSKESQEKEEIEIAAPEHFMHPRDAGYIGQGATKVGRYARFRGKEYVLTQIACSQNDESDVKKNIFIEYSLLCMGAVFKEQFDEIVDQKGVRMPPFYFNFKDSILGRAVADDFGEVYYHSKPWFIATPLLPCGANDPDIKKFTGSNTLGPKPPKDKITQAIHCFTHFSFMYTQGQFVFCDLQGARDKEGVMCLIDPQAHTLIKTPGSVGDIYWNGGSELLQKFKDDHAMHCGENSFCTALGLANVHFYNDSDDEERPAKRLRKAPKVKIEDLCEETD